MALYSHRLRSIEGLGNGRSSSNGVSSPRNRARIDATQLEIESKVGTRELNAAAEQLEAPETAVSRETSHRFLISASRLQNEFRLRVVERIALQQLRRDRLDLSPVLSDEVGGARSQLLLQVRPTTVPSRARSGRLTELPNRTFLLGRKADISTLL